MSVPFLDNLGTSEIAACAIVASFCLFDRIEAGLRTVARWFRG